MNDLNDFKQNEFEVLDVEFDSSINLPRWNFGITNTII